MLTDPIADMITRIRNANAVHKRKLTMPASRMKVGIAQVLKEEGYITSYEVRSGEPQSHLDIHLRDRVVELTAGQLFVVPRGVEHKPVAHGEVEALLFEPASTVNTGNVRNERTVEAPEKI